MSSEKYSIGVDFGTLSARAVIVNVKTGEELATADSRYRHGVLDKFLPDGKTIVPPNWALQYTGDYLNAISEVIPLVINKAGISADDVIGLGTDFTGSTIAPIDADGIPLCMKEEFKNNPHAYVKLWKHHGAQQEALGITRIAKERKESFLQRYGGMISSEMMLPKIWQTLNEAPEIYQAADRFIEMCDWITLYLTGKERRSACAAGYRALWDKLEGYPSEKFFRALDLRLENVVDEKLGRDVYAVGSKAGELTAAAARITGLNTGTAIAVGIIDAHAGLPGVGITEPGRLVMIMGTSGCDLILDVERKDVPGIFGVVTDGIIPGYFSYEAGQTGLGDIYQWAIDNCVSETYYKEAERRNLSIFQLMNDKAAVLAPGESGLLALDWWNGNRSVLMDFDLSGLMVGYTLSTKPEEIYRALLEATAFGKRKIIENYLEYGIQINEIIAAGGIPDRNPLLMQIFADVLEKEIKITNSQHSTALGAAILGAVAAGEGCGGYSTIREAAKSMAKNKTKSIRPIPENSVVYNKLYNEYLVLHDYFRRGGNDVMKRIRKIRNDVK